MSRDHYKGVPKLIDARVNEDGELKYLSGSNIKTGKLERTFISFPTREYESATEPPTVAVGTTRADLVGIGDFIYAQTPLQPRIDRTQDITFTVGWAPAGSESGQTVTWELAVTAPEEGSDLTVSGTQILAVDVEVPETVGTYVRTMMSIPTTVFSGTGTDELHMRLGRLPSSNDPAADPGVHDISVFQHIGG